MPINSATPQASYTHIFGSGALSYSWFRRAKCVNWDGNYDNVPDNWEVLVTIEDGDADENDRPTRKTVAVNHKNIMAACRKILADREMDEHGFTKKYGAGNLTIRECRNMIYDADEVDWDAPLASNLLEIITIGKVTYC